MNRHSQRYRQFEIMESANPTFINVNVWLQGPAEGPCLGAGGEPPTDLGEFEV